MENKDYLDGETKTFIDDLSFDGTIAVSYRPALPNMTSADALKLKELREKFWRIDPHEDQKDGAVITLGVLGEIERLLKEIIARTNPST